MILATLMSVPIFMSPEVMEEAGRELSSMLNLNELGDELSGADDDESEADDEEGLEATIDVVAPAVEPPVAEPLAEMIEEEPTPLLPVLSEVEGEPTRLDALRAQMQRLVAEEAYEEAARIRDQITELEAEESDN
jgi:hypothetical protein